MQLCSCKHGVPKSRVQVPRATSLAAADQKLQAARQLGARPTAITNLGMPGISGAGDDNPLSDSRHARLGHLSKIVD